MTDFGSPLLGIDTSSWTGTPPAGAMLDAGLTFVICKATESMEYNNPTYLPTRRETAAAGLIFGAYHYIRAGNGAAQCDRFLDVAGDLTGCLAALDVEDGADYPTVVAFIARWRERMGAAALLLYTGKWWWVGVAGNPDGAGLTPYLWDSNYINGSGSPRDLLAGVTPDYFPAYGGWGLDTRVIRQYSSSGTPMVGGESSVDCNVFYGSRAELEALTVGGAQPAPVDMHPGARIVKIGDSGPDVAALQAALGIVADGSFGPATDAAVRAFQVSVGLAADGIVGAETWKAVVIGDIGIKYRALGFVAGSLGKPQTIERGCPDGKGRFVHFDGGSIYWTPDTGAIYVHGAIRDKWQAIGWETSFIGYPTVDEAPCSDGAGRFSQFEHGMIYWSPTSTASVIRGDIQIHWQSLGAEGGLLGYPTTDETPTPDGKGRYSGFDHGVIYWTPDTGAHEVHGSILKAWAVEKWETGLLGYPTSDEHDADADVGDRLSSFQGADLVARGGNVYINRQVVVP
jgi:hypothetical protein